VATSERPKKSAAKKTRAKKSPAKQIAKKGAAAETAADVYGGMVAEIIDARPRSSTYQPNVPMTLRITSRRQPARVDELSPDEREQLQAIFEKDLPKALANPENEIEVAEVVDAQGNVHFRLYGWNYGVGYLFPPSGLDVVAFGSQHDIEHWSLAQRDLFVAMDRALRAKGHGFRQPLYFGWSDDSCWDEIKDEEPGTVGSEPHLREQLKAYATPGGDGRSLV
jgi:hypothetical protein